eukprot:3502109-Pyramimonas_sp.AAC.2
MSHALTKPAEQPVTKYLFCGSVLATTTVSPTRWPVSTCARRTNQMQEAWVYSHDGPIRCQREPNRRSAWGV